MEILEVAQKMQAVMNRIGELAGQLDVAGKEKAEAESEYDKAMTVAMLSLRCDGMQITLIKDIAKGRCSDVLLKAKVAESGYKSLITKIHAAESILNAYQSINKYLDKI